MPSNEPGLLIHNASEIATLAGGVRRGSAQADVALIDADEESVGGAHGPALAVFEGRIISVGRLAEVESRVAEMGIAARSITRLDAQRGTVTPGLIDPHTHLLFAGSRHAEVEMRQRGHDYLDILAAGGGILQTVRQTRAASDEQLLDHGRRWLREMLSHGVTTVEAKSGYGLDVATELRLLALADMLGSEGPVEIVPTFLGAHAVAPEYRERADGKGTAAYLASVINEQLPRVVEQGIATSCDVFCERGVFEAGAARRLLDAAREHGLAVRLHADQISESGAAQLAAELGALSADHLGAISEGGIEALAAAGEHGGRATIATLLPLASFYLDEDRDAPARRLIDAGVPVAVGTDFNPGTSPAPNAQLALAFAVHRLGLSAAEALAAMTINAAAALDMVASHGSLEIGKHADLVVWEPDTHELIPYWLGANLVRTVIKHGRIVLG